MEHEHEHDEAESLNLYSAVKIATRIQKPLDRILGAIGRLDLPSRLSINDTAHYNEADIIAIAEELDTQDERRAHESRHLARRKREHLEQRAAAADMHAVVIGRGLSAVVRHVSGDFGEAKALALGIADEEGHRAQIHSIRLPIRGKLEYAITFDTRHHQESAPASP